MDDLITQITGLMDKERKRVRSWMLSLPEEKLIDIFQSSVKNSFRLKEERPGVPGKVIKYCAFILAARAAGWDTLVGKGYRLAGEKQFTDFSTLRTAKAAELTQRGRKPVKKKKVLAYWGEVKELKSQGIGFRQIAAYLEKQRKIKVSASYLVHMWKEVEK